MLNRVINGARTATAKQVLIEVMERACRHPDADAATLRALTGFLERHRKADG
jgi:hypothetical protein